MNHDKEYYHVTDSNPVEPPERPPRIANQTPARQVNHPKSGYGGLMGGLFWFVATSLLVFTAWFVGPMLVTKYQYAATKGKVMAEYENASRILESEPLTPVSQAYQLVAQKIRPSVVNIKASSSAGGGQGSGVIMSSDGYIVTNEHVVRGAKVIEVILHDRKQYHAEIVGTDELNDLAVLKIDCPDLIAAEWGDSEELRVGSMVWAVGSPYGLEQTITSGILSAKNRSQRENSAQEFLQTDAAVNPGNSGGPLVNARGQVVGINTSIFGEQYQGISFAIPSCVAEFVFEELKSSGDVERGYLGVRPAPVMNRDMVRLQLPDLNGAIISYVNKGSPAAKSGLREDDVIRSWGGNDIVAYTNLYRYIAMTEPDSAAEVEIIRGGEEMTLEVCVEERPPEEVLRMREFRRN